MESSVSLGPEEGAGYSGAEAVAAAFITLFFSPVALLAALLLLRGQHDRRKRTQLRLWACISAGLLALQATWIVLQTVTF